MFTTNGFQTVPPFAKVVISSNLTTDDASFMKTLCKWLKHVSKMENADKSLSILLKMCYFSALFSLIRPNNLIGQHKYNRRCYVFPRRQLACVNLFWLNLTVVTVTVIMIYWNYMQGNKTDCKRVCQVLSVLMANPN